MQISISQEIYNIQFNILNNITSIHYRSEAYNIHIRCRCTKILTCNELLIVTNLIDKISYRNYKYERNEPVLNFLYYLYTISTILVKSAETTMIYHWFSLVIVSTLCLKKYNIMAERVDRIRL